MQAYNFVRGRMHFSKSKFLEKRVPSLPVINSEKARGRLEPVARGILLGEAYEWLQDEGVE